MVLIISLDVLQIPDSVIASMDTHSNRHSLVNTLALCRHHKSSSSNMTQRCPFVSQDQSASEEVLEYKQVSRKSSIQVEQKEPRVWDHSVWLPNKYDKDLIIKTWNNDLDFSYKIGCEIYEKIFANITNPSKIFPKVVRHGNGWKESNDFKNQALRFVQVISDAVRNLHNLSEFRATSLYSIGRAHCKYAHRGFRPQHWLLFQNAIKKTMKSRIRDMNHLNEKEKKDAVKAWFYLAEQIIEGMMKGFKDGMKAGKRKFSY